MKIFNTLTRRKEEFVPLEEGKVKMYVCGPTVYNLIHIGNARPMIIFDTVRRYMEYKGYEVNYVSNFTDVDDKIIKKAIEEGVSAEEISTRMTTTDWTIKNLRMLWILHPGIIIQAGIKKTIIPQRWTEPCSMILCEASRKHRFF